MNQSAEILLQIFKISSGIFGGIVFPLIKTWWWIAPPLLLVKPFIYHYLWWRRSLNIKKREFVLLEVRMPEESPKPIKAMEHVMTTLHMVLGFHDPGNFREKWIEGDTPFFPSLSFEVASFGGETHFFIRTEVPIRQWVESAIYSQYPEVEIVEVEDYTDFVPQDIPNAQWDLQCREFVLKKENAYPIRTYMAFESEKEDKEERRIDPLARLLESLSVLEEGEQVWLQFVVRKPEDDWKKEGEKLKDKLANRPVSTSKDKPMIIEALELLIKGPKEKEEKKEAGIPPEMKLTPGEREILKEVERKISKQGFETIVRVIYLAKRDVWFGPHLGLPIGFLKSFDTENLNKFSGFKPAATNLKTAPTWFLDARRNFVRKRKAFRNYKMRVNASFPRKGGTCILNTEELASVYHFPSRQAAPAPFVKRVESKKGEAPPELPVG
jgi:hypothetical protein